MNILYWADGFSPRIGGIETQGLCLTTEMKKRNHNCFVLANRDTPHFTEEECIEGVHISRFDFSAFRRKGVNGQDFLKVFEKKLMEIFEKTRLMLYTYTLFFKAIVHYFTYYLLENYLAPLS